MSAQVGPPDGAAGSSSLRSRAPRLTRRGQVTSDLKSMGLRETVRQTFLLVTVSAATAAAVSLIAGGPWPILLTAPAVAIVFLLASKAAWKTLVVAVGIGIAVGAAPLWIGGGLLVGVLLRRRVTWAVRRSRPRSLAWSTPLPALVAAGPRRGVALRYGLVRLRSGNRRGTRDLFTFVIQQPRRRGDRAARAAAHIGLAALARESADIAVGLAHTQAATGLLAVRRPRRLADRLLLEHGLLLHDGARHAEAVTALHVASERLWRGGDRRGAVAALAAAASSALVGDPHEGLRVAALARERAVRALDPNGLIRTELLLAQAAVASRDNTLAASTAHSVLTLASGLAASYARADEDLQTAVVDQAAAQGNAHIVLAHVAAGSGDDSEALKHVEEAIRLCDAAGRGYDTAAAELVATEVLERQGRRGAALRHALTAVAHLDRARYLLPTPRWRAEWIRSNEAAYGHALRLASASGDSRLVAELVEAARLQAVPRTPETHADVAGATRSLPLLDLAEPQGQPIEGGRFRGLDAAALRAAAAQAALGADPLRPSPILTIDGSSLLPKAEAAAGRLRVDISEEVTRLAGRDAWWWGGAVADGFYYWAVRGDGRFLSGRRPVKEGTPTGQALAELLDATPGPGLQEQGSSGVLAGPLSGRVIGGDDPHDRERNFAWRLSEAFLPPPVRERAITQFREQRQASHPEPFRLVVSLPAALCRLPVPLLALEPPVPQGGLSDVPRLVEAAVVHHAPSMALLASLAVQPPLPPPSPEEPWPLLVSVVDPTDDLEHAHGGDAPCVLLVGGRRLGEQARNGDPKARLATKAALRKALLDLPGRAGLLVYAGHAHPGHPDTPATGGLVLASPEASHPTDEVLGTAVMSGASAGAEQLLSARELLPRDGQPPPYPFPARVLLSACSTSGYGGTTERIPGLAGEWLGVAAAVLQAGADEVVATLFDVLDVRATTKFERRLITLLSSTPDAASAVRRAQVEALGEWRRNRRLPPLVWAPYACLGGMETIANRPA
jgi:tetratricopeptide (TPR) repeat protein